MVVLAEFDELGQNALSLTENNEYSLPEKSLRVAGRIADRRRIRRFEMLSNRIT